ncbi:hypothetical protein [Bradyrhizobium sp. CCBAU 53421]|uniref:hypothetical protein n=1 Tax=Bradyrhizobium sp. CCBAU 53421 TaxID=1325120 RepID=UPI00188A8DED|nr:hypothetical protein [Bradyrhizobium sp. CCBAU 53421]QOZ31307.1 hypothetical protein XH92_05845 [Bradyrhizobium sp. CCBAU 53421]
MSVSAKWLKGLIETELATIDHEATVAFIRQRLVEPHAVMRDWDYGSSAQQYPCWTAFEDRSWDLALAYCNEGHGPQRPWGMVSISESGPLASIGMDTSWHPGFVAAFLDSGVASELPIWRVYRQNDDLTFTPLTSSGEWKAAWESRDHFAEHPKENRFFVLDALRDPNQWLAP